MAAVTWSTHGLPHKLLQDAFSSKLSDLHVNWTLSIPEPDGFDASVRYRKVDRLTIGELRSGRITGQRAASGDAPLLGVLMNLSGRLACRYEDGREVVLPPNHLLIWDSELGFDFDVEGSHREFYLLVPRERVPLTVASAATHLCGALPAVQGSGLSAIAGEHLRTISQELDQLSDGALAIACQSFFDLLDAALTVNTHRPSSKAILLNAIRQYIDKNLDDPELCAASIANAHHISVRKLHVTFAGTGTTVSRWIRDRRLKVCYRELCAAASTKTVTDVAYKWGFNDAAHFSRTFKQAFGVTPRSLRIGSTVPALDDY
ncbi:helix-turn-helix domain-containing protein [Paraburkholderia sp. BL10I2N1]|uniref:helix-turn-helix domain-containing protein n=1 Tax=Paraburkholderia sp. BL10I2N1 TaxID=1938796 RepID=UPI0010E37397|nr:helix-turn-helix domain-containing protein [Paraburkholderia sp. BL10I2N1]TDN70039.1 AraC family transcriptional regulator [Paraburkholderia sp. BL10I2N1]